MFRGFRVSLAIEPQGTLVSTNSPYVEGNRVTLFEMNMDELLAASADPSLLAGMPARPPADLEEARKLLAQFTLCLEPEVVECRPRHRSKCRGSAQPAECRVACASCLLPVALLALLSCFESSSQECQYGAPPSPPDRREN